MERGSEQARQGGAPAPSLRIKPRPGHGDDARPSREQPDAVRIAFSTLAAAGAALQPGQLEAGPPRLVSAHPGDHALVYALLRVVNQAPSYEDFLSWLDEPSYEPTDRLLVKQGDQLVAHVQLLQRAAWFEGVQIPVVGVHDLAVLPEYAQAGYERLLLYAAEQTMRDSGAVLSIVRTQRPEAFLNAGWSEARAQGCSRAAIGDVLAHLTAQEAARRRMVGKRSNAKGADHGSLGTSSLEGVNPCSVHGHVDFQIRRWRHVELDGVQDVYAAAACRAWGALCRTELYWRWLIGRKAHSDLIIALVGGERSASFEESGEDASIVGYAVTHGSQVLELHCLPGYEEAGPRLLARACRDAIERDYHTISLHAPAGDPLHEVMVTAGGSWCCERDVDGALLVKLLDPPRWVQAMFPLLRRRAKVAGLARPWQVVFDTGGEAQRLVLTRRRSRLIADDAHAAEVLCDLASFLALLIGNLDPAQRVIEPAACAPAQERGVVQTQSGLRAIRAGVLEELTALFPPALFWQSHFDVLRF